VVEAAKRGLRGAGGREVKWGKRGEVVRSDDDDEVYYARGPPAQRALLLIYYINNSFEIP
jgi:hypothetical protein